MKERFNHFRVGLRLLHSGALMERYRNRYVALHRAVGGGAATVTLRVTPMLSDIPRYFPRHYPLPVAVTSGVLTWSCSIAVGGLHAGN